MIHINPHLLNTHPRYTPRIPVPRVPRVSRPSRAPCAHGGTPYNVNGVFTVSHCVLLCKLSEHIERSEPENISQTNELPIQQKGWVLRLQKTAEAHKPATRVRGGSSKLSPQAQAILAAEIKRVNERIAQATTAKAKKYEDIAQECTAQDKTFPYLKYRRDGNILRNAFFMMKQGLSLLDLMQDKVDDYLTSHRNFQIPNNLENFAVSESDGDRNESDEDRSESNEDVIEPDVEIFLDANSARDEQVVVKSRERQSADAVEFDTTQMEAQAQAGFHTLL